MRCTATFRFTRELLSDRGYDERLDACVGIDAVVGKRTVHVIFQ